MLRKNGVKITQDAHEIQENVQKREKTVKKNTGKNPDILFFALPAPFMPPLTPLCHLPLLFFSSHPPSHATRHASPLPHQLGLFLPPHRGYLIGGAATGQIGQGEAGPLCHTCAALMHLERRDQHGERPGRTKGVLQPHKTHEKRETHMTRTKK